MSLEAQAIGRGRRRRQRLAELAAFALACLIGTAGAALTCAVLDAVQDARVAAGGHPATGGRP